MQQPRIWLVEDEQSIADTLVYMLQQEGFQVTVFGRGLPALEAAAQGRGVILGLMPIVWRAPIARRLVQPFAIPPISAGTYFLVHRREDAARPAVRAFTEWVCAQARADRRRSGRPAPSG